MQIALYRGEKFKNVDTVILFLCEGKDYIRSLHIEPELRAHILKFEKDSGFTGAYATGLTWWAGEGGVRKVALCGLGPEGELDFPRIQKQLRRIMVQCRRNKDKTIALCFPPRIKSMSEEESRLFFLETTLLADYTYHSYKTEDKEAPTIEKVYLISKNGDDAVLNARLVKEAGIVAEATVLARDLGNAPANDLTPTALASQARQVAKGLKIECSIYGRAQLEKMKMGGILSVARGSEQEPKLIVLDYAGQKKNLATIALVGKGITFDSGGISIKPAANMEEMKYDMMGAAAVICAIKAAAELKLPFRLIGITPASENLPSGSATKPGDIIKMYSGKTVEVINTDAEGRMILADALAYAETFKPDTIIDLATLTGACVVALGYSAAGCMSTDALLSAALVQAGERCGERVWPLPVWDDYFDLIRSDWADMKNSGGRAAGSLTAGVFLKSFVKPGTSWAHLDIAGTAWHEGEKPEGPRGATGYGVRLLIQYLKDRQRAAS